MRLSQIILSAKVVLALLLCSVFAHPANCSDHGPGQTSSVFYVATTGSDANPGSEALPWKTIQKAADTLVAGDTVYIRGGTYWERVAPVNSGAEGSPITYSAYPGESVTVDGAVVVVPEWGGLFDLGGRSYITVSGIRVVNSRPNPHNTGILIDSSHHILVKDCSTYNTNDSGIGVWGSHDIVVEGCEVSQACLAGFNEAISVGGSHDFEVRGCNVHDIAKEGICPKDGSYRGKVHGNHVHHNSKANIYIDAWDKHTHDIEVYGNTLHDSAHNGIAIASEQGGLLENIKVFNNLSYDNGWVGIHMTTCCTNTHPVSNIQIVNNTLVNNGLDPWGGGILIENPQAQGVVIRNNICSQNLSFQIAVPQGVSCTVDHNLIDGFRGDPDEVRGSFFVEGDPLFVNATAKNFRLKPGSPALMAGTTEWAPTNDFDGYPRSTPPDMGAFEHHLCALSCEASASPGTGIAPLTVAFSATAIATDCTGAPAFAWTFGDGGISNQQNPSHTYSAAGVYPWAVTVSIEGRVCYGRGTVTVTDPCSLTCSASAAPSAGIAPLAVSFAGEAILSSCTGVPTFFWAFGDGASSSEQSPEHIYAIAGEFSWTLTVTVEGLTCSRGGSIQVSPPCSLTCGASAAPASGPVPLSVAFIGEAVPSNCSGEPIFSWIYGDGASSSEQSPIHTYLTAGNFSWTMTVTVEGKSCSQGGSIQVSDVCSLTCGAAATPSSGQAPLSVAFTGEAQASHCSGEPVYLWDFGDGATSSERNPSHQYALAGVYSWAFAVTVDGEICNKQGTVTVSEGCSVVCTAAVPSGGRSRAPIVFSASAAAQHCGEEPTFAWEFGDGGTASGPEVSHTYTSAGAYSWKLRAGAGGQICERAGSVEIQPKVPGDCDDDGVVTIGEVQRAINMFLGLIPAGCGADCSGDGTISIGELQKVINTFLSLSDSC